MSTKQACERYWGRNLRPAKLGEREEQYAVGLKETWRVGLEPELCFVLCSFPLFFLLFQAYDPQHLEIDSAPCCYPSIIRRLVSFDLWDTRNTKQGR